VFVGATVVFSRPYALIVAEPASDNSGLGNPAAAREVRQHPDRVVTDCNDAQPIAAEFSEAARQLHELRFAVRSPIGGPEEDEHRPFRPEQRFERPRLSV